MATLILPETCASLNEDNINGMDQLGKMTAMRKLGLHIMSEAMSERGSGAGRIFSANYRVVTLKMEKAGCEIIVPVQNCTMVQDIREMLVANCQPEGKKKRVEVDIECFKKVGMYKEACHDWEPVPSMISVAGNIDKVLMKPARFCDTGEDDAQVKQAYQQTCEDWWHVNSKSCQEAWGAKSTRMVRGLK
mmetsp:Transcript_31444/g.68887  ORF Transcript_31444/g.68887 Transcript_31444/m.68887 type:complete len:190 (+) Transcript_31444:88-657(+)